MNNGCFIVKTTGGKTFAFDGRCNRVKYNNEHLCMFYYDETNSSELLAMIPYSQIAYIYKRPGNAATE